MKICLNCKQSKSEISFSRDKQKPDGFRAYCRKCVSDRYLLLKKLRLSGNEIGLDRELKRIVKNKKCINTKQSSTK